MSSAPSDTALRAPGGTLHVDIGEDPAVRLVFTGRVDDAGNAANLSLVVGEGDVDAARRRALAKVAATPARAVFMEQVHGGAVARVTSADAGRGAYEHSQAIPQVDALVTEATDLALVVMVADCVPVMLVNPGSGVAAVHAGRRGVAQNIVAAAVRKLAGDDASRVVAIVGPAIGGCCYEVPAAMADEVSQAWPAARATSRAGTASLDLPAAVAAQLHASGVARVQRHGTCTRCASQRYFSHRATTNDGAPAGRQAGIIMRVAAGRSAASPAPRASAPCLDSPSSS